MKSNPLTSSVEDQGRSKSFLAPVQPKSIEDSLLQLQFTGVPPPLVAARSVHGARQHPNLPPQVSRALATGIAAPARLTAAAQLASQMFGRTPLSPQNEVKVRQALEALKVALIRDGLNENDATQAIILSDAYQGIANAVSLPGTLAEAVLQNVRFNVDVVIQERINALQGSRTALRSLFGQPKVSPRFAFQDYVVRAEIERNERILKAVQSGPTIGLAALRRARQPSRPSIGTPWRGDIIRSRITGAQGSTFADALAQYQASLAPH